MKRIKILIITAVSMLLLGSCALTREDYNQIYVDAFFKSENDCKLALTSLYHPFNTNWKTNDEGVFCSNNQGYQIFTELSTDGLNCTWGWEWDELHFHKWYATKTGGEMNIFYKAFARYNHLSTCRNVIRNIENSTISDEIKAKYIAEAKAIRGWMALYLYDLFGPVPVASDAVLDDATTFHYLPRLSEDEWEQMMENDLLYAIDNLPATTTERGRMTKGSARMMLLKYYMIRRNFTKALPIARDLYKMEQEGVYTLMEKYEDVFKKSRKGNKELILQIPCNSLDMPNYWVAHVVPDNYPHPSPTAANWGAFRMPWAFYDTFESGDDRLKGIIASYTAKNGDSEVRGAGQLQKGALPLKYELDPQQVGSGTDIDVVVYRFADVLLSFAECINETNGAPTSEAIDLVNRIRLRVNLPILAADKTATKDAFNEAILMERGHELYCEGLRRQDLIRHGKYITTAALRPGNQTASHKVRFPVPLYFITESKDSIQQNTGY